MRDLTKEELQKIYGGAISATLLNAFIRGINTIFEESLLKMHALYLKM